VTGPEVLTLQVKGSFDRILDLSARAQGDGWTEIAFEGANPVGFTLWHCARTIDWAVQCAVRGVDEVVRRPEWADRVGGDSLFGAGTTYAGALSISREVTPEDVRAYSEAVRGEVMNWLGAQDAASLDQVPEFRAHQVEAGYDRPAIWEAIADLEGIPAWQLLARPAVAHVRTHGGEMDVLLQAISRRTPSASA
jgi:hypothetical protein